MKQYLFSFIAIGGALGLTGAGISFDTNEFLEAEPVKQVARTVLSPYQQMMLELQNWERPEGPVTVALQVGHLDNHEAPEEFPNLAKNTGAEAGGVREVDLNLEIAEAVKPLLEQDGVEVEILPAVIPPDYYADVFVSIHGDGSENTSKRGYKAAASHFDITGEAEQLAQSMNEAYGEATGLRFDPNVSNNMLYYYAFNWRRYEHSLHPKTVGILLETGFLSNTQDRNFLINNTEKSVQGIVNGVMDYIESSELRELLSTS
jgi:N-acetylmuramoyl-L-alanine amidase